MTEYIDDLLLGLDEKPISLESLSKALATLDGYDSNVTEVSIVAGTECRQGNANSVVLSMSSPTSPPRQLFLKKMSAKAFGNKTWVDLRRTLAYARTEVRFYREFASDLVSKGVIIPRCALIEDRLQALLGDSEVVAPPGELEPSAAQLNDAGAILLLECADASMFQGSPLSESQAQAALRAAADLHAAAWEDTTLLSSAATRLQRYGGSFALSIRNPKELTKIRPNWTRFMEVFSSHDPDLFATPSVKQLGERLERWSLWIAKQLEVSPADPGATLIHGDYKAMNIFLPPIGDEDKSPAMLIDFASTGVGYGPSDIAMHLCHSVPPSVLDHDDGENRLLHGYFDALTNARQRVNKADAEASAAEYPKELAMRHYHLAIVDYGRFVVSRFWHDATPELFAKHQDVANRTLPNRSIPAALRLIRRMDECLAIFESEGVNPCVV